MLNVTNKRFTPNIVMLNVVMLNVVASIEQLGCHLIGPEMLDYDLKFQETH